jgi:hypothetical protein
MMAKMRGLLNDGEWKSLDIEVKMNKQIKNKQISRWNPSLNQSIFTSEIPARRNVFVIVGFRLFSVY